MPSVALVKHLRSRRAIHGLTTDEMKGLVDYMCGRTDYNSLSDHEARLVLVEMTTNSTDELKKRILRHKEGK